MTSAKTVIIYTVIPHLQRSEKNMSKRTRLSAACGAVLLIFALIFSVLFVAVEANHDCSGEHCTICHQVQICQTLLEQLSTVRATLAGTTALCFFAVLLVLRTQMAIIASSPVLLRVKLLN